MGALKKSIVLFVLSGILMSNAASAKSFFCDLKDIFCCQEDADKSGSELDTDEKLGFTYDLTYHTKWMSKGYSVYSEHGAWLNTMVVDLWQSGFGLAVAYDMASDGGHVGRERIDYSLFYGSNFFEDGLCETKCKVSWTYKDYLREHDQKIDCHELAASVCLPQILGGTLFPKYVVNYATSAGAGYDNRGIAGWAHNIGLCYDLKMASLDDQEVVLDAMATYNDGFGDKGHAWSHVTFGATTVYEVNENISFVPGVYYQLAMNGMENETEDTLYAKFSFRYKF